MYWTEGMNPTHGNRIIDKIQIWRYTCRRHPAYEQRWFDDWCGEWFGGKKHE